MTFPGWLGRGFGYEPEEVFRRRRKIAGLPPIPGERRRPRSLGAAVLRPGVERAARSPTLPPVMTGAASDTIIDIIREELRSQQAKEAGKGGVGEAILGGLKIAGDVADYVRRATTEPLLAGLSEGLGFRVNEKGKLEWGGLKAINPFAISRAVNEVFVGDRSGYLEAAKELFQGDIKEAGKKFAVALPGAWTLGEQEQHKEFREALWNTAPALALSLELGTDPLTYLGPGAVGKVAKVASVAARGSRAAKVAAKAPGLAKAGRAAEVALTHPRSPIGAIIEGWGPKRGLKASVLAGVGHAAAQKIGEEAGGEAGGAWGGLAGGLLGAGAMGMVRGPGVREVSNAAARAAAKEDVQMRILARWSERLNKAAPNLSAKDQKALMQSMIEFHNAGPTQRAEMIASEPFNWVAREGSAQAKAIARDAFIEAVIEETGAIPSNARWSGVEIDRAVMRIEGELKLSEERKGLIRKGASVLKAGSSQEGSPVAKSIGWENAASQKPKQLARFLEAVGVTVEELQKANVTEPATQRKVLDAMGPGAIEEFAHQRTGFKMSGSERRFLEAIDKAWRGRQEVPKSQLEVARQQAAKALAEAIDTKTTERLQVTDELLARINPRVEPQAAAGPTLAQQALKRATAYEQSPSVWARAVQGRTPGLAKALVRGAMASILAAEEELPTELSMATKRAIALELADAIDDYDKFDDAVAKAVEVARRHGLELEPRDLIEAIDGHFPDDMMNFVPTYTQGQVAGVRVQPGSPEYREELAGGHGLTFAETDELREELEGFARAYREDVARVAARTESALGEKPSAPPRAGRPPKKLEEVMDVVNRVEITPEVDAALRSRARRLAAQRAGGLEAEQREYYRELFNYVARETGELSREDIDNALRELFPREEPLPPVAISEMQKLSEEGEEALPSAIEAKLSEDFAKDALQSPWAKTDEGGLEAVPKRGESYQDFLKREDVLVPAIAVDEDGKLKTVPGTGLAGPSDPQDFGERALNTIEGSFAVPERSSRMRASALPEEVRAEVTRAAQELGLTDEEAEGLASIAAATVDYASHFILYSKDGHPISGAEAAAIRTLRVRLEQLDAEALERVRELFRKGKLSAQDVEALREAIRIQPEGPAREGVTRLGQDPVDIALEEAKRIPSDLGEFFVAMRNDLLRIVELLGGDVTLLQRPAFRNWVEDLAAKISQVASPRELPLPLRRILGDSPETSSMLIESRLLQSMKQQAMRVVSLYRRLANIDAAAAKKAVAVASVLRIATPATAMRMVVNVWAAERVATALGVPLRRVAHLGGSDLLRSVELFVRPDDALLPSERTIRARLVGLAQEALRAVGKEAGATQAVEAWKELGRWLLQGSAARGVPVLLQAGARQRIASKAIQLLAAGGYEITPELAQRVAQVAGDALAAAGKRSYSTIMEQMPREVAQAVAEELSGASKAVEPAKTMPEIPGALSAPQQLPALLAPREQPVLALPAPSARQAAEAPTPLTAAAEEAAPPAPTGGEAAPPTPPQRPTASAGGPEEPERPPERRVPPPQGGYDPWAALHANPVDFAQGANVKINIQAQPAGDTEQLRITAKYNPKTKAYELTLNRPMSPRELERVLASPENAITIRVVTPDGRTSEWRFWVDVGEGGKRTLHFDGEASRIASVEGTSAVQKLMSVLYSPARARVQEAPIAAMIASQESRRELLKALEGELTPEQIKKLEAGEAVEVPYKHDDKELTLRLQLRRVEAGNYKLEVSVAETGARRAITTTDPRLGPAAFFFLDSLFKKVGKKFADVASADEVGDVLGGVTHALNAHVPTNVADAIRASATVGTDQVLPLSVEQIRAYHSKGTVTVTVKEGDGFVNYTLRKVEGGVWVSRRSVDPQTGKASESRSIFIPNDGATATIRGEGGEVVAQYTVTPLQIETNLGLWRVTPREPEARVAIAKDALVTADTVAKLLEGSEVEIKLASGAKGVLWMDNAGRLYFNGNPIGIRAADGRELPVELEQVLEDLGLRRHGEWVIEPGQVRDVSKSPAVPNVHVETNLIKREPLAPLAKQEFTDAMQALDARERTAAPLHIYSSQMYLSMARRKLAGFEGAIRQLWRKAMGVMRPDVPEAVHAMLQAERHIAQQAASWFTVQRLRLERAFADAGMVTRRVGGRVLIVFTDAKGQRHELSPDEFRRLYALDPEMVGRVALTEEQKLALLELAEAERRVWQLAEANGITVARDTSDLPRQSPMYATHIGKADLAKLAPGAGEGAGIKLHTAAPAAVADPLTAFEEFAAKVFEELVQTTKERVLSELAPDQFLRMSPQAAGVDPKNFRRIRVEGWDRRYVWATDEMAKAIERVTAVPWIARSALGKLMQWVNWFFTPIMATLDYSAAFQHGAALWTLSPIRTKTGPKGPIRFAKVFYNTWVSVLRDDRAYGSMLYHEAQRVTDALARAGVEVDGLEFAAQRGLHFTDPGVIDSNFRDDILYRADHPFMRIPLAKGVFKFSNKLFARHLNVARMMIFADEVERAVAKGLTGEELLQHLDSAAKGINRAFGFSDARIHPTEGLTFFAPRYFRSKFEEVFVGLFSNDPVQRRIARRHLYAFGGIMAGTIIAHNLAFTNDSPEEVVAETLDPKSSNFMTFRNFLGTGTDVKPLGGSHTVVRYLAAAFGSDIVAPTVREGKPDINAAVNDALRLVQSKGSVATNMVWAIATGEDPLGQPVEIDPYRPETVARFLGERSLPFSVQAFLDGETMGERFALYGASFLGLSANPMSPWEKRDAVRDHVSLELFGVRYDDLPAEVAGYNPRAIVNEDPRVQKAEEKVLETEARQKGARSTLAQARQEYLEKIRAAGQYLQNGRDAAGNPYSGNDYRKAYQQATAEYVGIVRALRKQGKASDDVAKYFELYDKARMEDGSIDWDLFDRLEAEFVAENPGVLEKVQKLTGVYDDPVAREYRIARKQAAEYYKIPRFVGMDPEDAERAAIILDWAEALVGQGRAPNWQYALRLLADSGQISEEDVMLVAEAKKRGENPARKQFRLEHPEFAKFYSDAAMVDMFEALFPEASRAMRLPLGMGMARPPRARGRRASWRRRTRAFMPAIPGTS